MKLIFSFIVSLYLSGIYVVPIIREESYLLLPEAKKCMILYKEMYEEIQKAI